MTSKNIIPSDDSLFIYTINNVEKTVSVKLNTNYNSQVVDLLNTSNEVL